jgi:hypothetical protein
MRKLNRIWLSRGTARKMNRSDRAEGKVRELFGGAQLSGRDLGPEFFDTMKYFTYEEVFHQGSLDNRQPGTDWARGTDDQSVSLRRLSSCRDGTKCSKSHRVGIKESLCQCAPFIGFPKVKSRSRS